MPHASGRPVFLFMAAYGGMGLGTRHVMAAQSLRTSVSLCRFPRLVSALGFRAWFPRLVSAAGFRRRFLHAVFRCCFLLLLPAAVFPHVRLFRRDRSVSPHAPHGLRAPQCSVRHKKGRIRRTDTPAWPYAAGRGLLLDYLELVLANAAKRANPILGNIFECRAGGDATFGVADCRVINPIAYGATILFIFFDF